MDQQVVCGCWVGGTTGPLEVVIINLETLVSTVALLSSHIQLLRCRHRADGELDLTKVQVEPGEISGRKGDSQVHARSGQNDGSRNPSWTREGIAVKEL